MPSDTKELSEKERFERFALFTFAIQSIAFAFIIFDIIKHGQNAFDDTAIIFWVLYDVMLIVVYWIQLDLSRREERSVPVLARISREESLRIANDRIQKLLQRPSDFRLIEQPAFSNGVLVDNDKFAQLSKSDETVYRELMEWYMRKPELLLSERVIDGLWYLYEINKMEKEKIPFPIVKLKRQPQPSKEYFDFEVILQTSHPSQLRNMLESYLPWFGISLSIQVLKTPVLYFGSCVQPGGLEGNVGGAVRTTPVRSPSYPVTCAHVTSPACKSTLFRNYPSRDEYGPDVAVLRGLVPCFDIHPVNERVVDVATDDEIDNLKRQRAAIRKIYPSKQADRKGEIEERVMSITIGETTHRFPHHIVLPKFMDRLFFITPLFRKEFSRQGNSGEWVVDCQHNKWIGMIVGGRPRPYYISYIIDAEPLMIYLSTKMEEPLEPVFF